MNIKDTWLLIRSDKNILVNLYWFIKCRSCGLCIKHTLIEHEIALSDGNMKLINDTAGIESLIDITERNAIYRLNFTGGNVLLISHDKKDINANSTAVSRFIPCIDYNIETDLDSEVERLNKRLKLIGSDVVKTTDGVEVLDWNEDDESVNSEKLKVHHFGVMDVTDCNVLNITECLLDGEVNMRVKCDIPKTLRYIKCFRNYMNLQLDSNIDILEVYCLYI